MAIDYTAILNRVADIAEAAMTSIGVTADAVPYFLHTQEAFPYFTVRISGVDVDSDSEEYDTELVTVTLRIIVAHATQGYVGEPETALYTYMPTLREYFNARQFLQSATYTTALTHLIQARMTSSTGLRIFENSGLAALQVGAEFNIECQFEIELAQAYY